MEFSIKSIQGGRSVFEKKRHYIIVKYLIIPKSTILFVFTTFMFTSYNFRVFTWTQMRTTKVMCIGHAFRKTLCGRQRLTLRDRRRYAQLQSFAYRRCNRNAYGRPTTRHATHVPRNGSLDIIIIITCDVLPW